MTHRQIVIIGAGVSGACIARELSRRELDVLVVERASDVCEGTSKANSGIVHAGYDARPGTLKAELNVEGNRMMAQLSKELDFPFINNGSMVLCFEESGIPKLEELKARGEANGVEGLKILYRDPVSRNASGDKTEDTSDNAPVWETPASAEPNISPDVVAALIAPTGGIVDPFLLNVAMAENANVNGVDFAFDTEVVSIEKNEGGSGYILDVIRHPSLRNHIDAETGDRISADIVINAAGVFADRFHNMVSAGKINITARKGEYCLLDKKTGGYVRHTLFQLPTAMGKGVLITPTTHGNILIGPTAVDVEDRDTTDTTAEGLSGVIQTAGRSVAALPSGGNIITSFAGLRAHEDNGDFIIKEVEDAPGFIDVAGIESPGLSCAPAIGVYVSEIVDRICPSEIKKDFVAERRGITSMSHADDDLRAKCIAENPAYANVICRCELVTEGEIVDAINRPVGAVTLDGIKRRVRAGMGRCQAGFCTPRQTAILAGELGVDIEKINKKGYGSGLLDGYNKE
ncbi:MAG: NAD(P)/FAD-dependent oxidoreductase [Lachnospiraceae bacterium]|nr:NAD(P)/FAD-dependent oxidoreductase [Lachnospiraceae bacterium]